MNFTLITSFLPDVPYRSKRALLSWEEQKIAVVVCGEIKDKVVLNTARNVPQVLTEEDVVGRGTGRAPVLRDMIQKCLPHCHTEYVGIINGDCIVHPRFFSRFTHIMQPDMFVSSARYDGYTWSSAVPHQDESGDLFVASYETFKRLGSEIPEYIMGRNVWDNWIQMWADRSPHLRCFNSTDCLQILHPPHEYDHLRDGLTDHPSVRHNYRIFEKRHQYSEMINLRQWEKLPCVDR